MSRSGLHECEFLDTEEILAHGRWRGQVSAVIRGKNGQAFLRELVAALDALPEKRLISNNLEHAGNVCAVGSVGLARGLDMSEVDYDDPFSVAQLFGVAHQLISEIEWMNDEYHYETPEKRWAQMRAWAVSKIRD